MECNVCGGDKRCYALIEADVRYGSPKPLGLSFYICTDCLDELITPIKKDKTKLDDPAKTDMRSLRQKVRKPHDMGRVGNVDGELTRG